MEYEVLVSDSITELEKNVTGYLRSGWLCQGGFTMICRTFTDRDGYDREIWTYAQAMILIGARTDDAALGRSAFTVASQRPVSDTQ